MLQCALIGDEKYCTFRQVGGGGGGAAVRMGTSHWVRTPGLICHDSTETGTVDQKHHKLVEATSMEVR
jgi:hypothetical protein